MNKKVRAVERSGSVADDTVPAGQSIAETVAAEEREVESQLQSAEESGGGGDSSASNGESGPPRRRARVANPALANESKSERFRRLANKRVSRAIKDLLHVQRLANRGQYEYTEGQAARVIEALTAALAGVRTAFAGTKERNSLFTL